MVEYVVIGDGTTVTARMGVLSTRIRMSIRGSSTGSGGGGRIVGGFSWRGGRLRGSRFIRLTCTVRMTPSIRAL